MADTGTDIQDLAYTVEYASQISGRSKDMLYRYIKEEVIASVPDPHDGRVRLIPWTEMNKVLRQPKRGLSKREVVLTRSDGSKFTKVVAVPLPGKEA